MAVATENPSLLTDGDLAFLRVDNRRPPHALEPGTAHSMTNKRSENGQAAPRYGAALDGWGEALVNFVPPGAAYTLISALYRYVVTTLVAGETYLYRAAGETTSLTVGAATIAPGATFTYISGTVTLFAASAQTVVSRILRVASTCAYKRFNDPTTDTDNGVIVTDDWRDQAGEDGGRGRVYRIYPTNGPQLIPLNGHDVWGTGRLVQCRNAMMLLRHGNGRHYFSAAALGTQTIQLNTTPPWAVGSARRVEFQFIAGSAIAGGAPPVAGSFYFAKHLAEGSNQVSLYTDSQMEFLVSWDASPTGKFYVEYAEEPEPFYGNGAKPLLMQPNYQPAQNAFEAGFEAMLADVEITGTNTTSALITAPNHRLVAGDRIVITDVELETGPGANDVDEALDATYAAPQSEHTFRVYETALNALADDGATGLLSPVLDNDLGSLRKYSAAAQPLPPCREGVYYQGRFIGINGKDTLLISDPFDFLHYTLFAAVAANQGEAGAANWLMPLGRDVLLIGKQLKILVISGLSGPASGWRMETLTEAYGGIAPLGAVNVGADAWLWSRIGVASVTRTEAGETLGVTRTVSQPIPKYLADLDWSQAANACFETWNNRFFAAVTPRGNTTNNRLLVLNFLNQFLRVRQEVLAGDLVGGVYETSETADSWEGVWTGPLLQVAAFAKLQILGEERLTWATPTGLVCWFHEGWDDAGAEISDEIIPRAYFSGREVLALKGFIRQETFRPKFSAYIRSAGFNEETQLSGFNQKTYDPTKYLVDGQADYVPATSTPESFDLPHREDYSATAEELLSARLDVHQAITEPFRCRVRDHSPQLRIVNEQGSARLAAVVMQAKAVGVSATRKT